MSVEKIKAALEKLDFQNDTQWTEDGLPRVDTVKAATGLFALTREQVTQAWPGFSRAALQGLGQAAAGAPADPVSAPASAPTDTPAAPVAASPAQAPVPDPAVASNSSQQDPEGDDSHLKGGEGDGSEVLQAEPKGEREVLQAELALAQERLARARAAKKEADQEYAQANQAVDDLIAKGEKVLGEESLADTLNQYQASQARRREERIAQMEAMKGVDLKSLFITKAPIDSAFSRKTARGTQRPGSKA